MLFLEDSPIAMLLPGLYWYGKRAKKPRVRLLLIRSDQILLVKNWLGYQKWTLPGGGVGADETERRALRREIQEEVGLIISEEEPIHVGTFLPVGTPASFHISVYVLQIDEAMQIKQNTHELIAARWFAVTHLQPNISPEFRQMYDHYLHMQQ